jgi:lysophospholipid acyltransferase (LPLAT)-like uncharacterized protein
MKRDMAGGRPTAFTVDGPRGPARTVQSGVVWLAAATGCPILPFHIEAASQWTLGSWDRTQIPRPFTNVAVAFGEPIEVPRDPDEPTLERYRVRLERALNGLESKAAAMLVRPDPQE